MTGKRDRIKENAMKLLAKGLPKVYEEYQKVTKVSGSNAIKFIEENGTDEQKAVISKMDPAKLYDMKQTAIRLINHKHRLFEAWQKGGKRGVAEYLVFINDQRKYINEKYFNKTDKQKVEDDIAAQN